MNPVNRAALGEIRQNNGGLCSGKTLENFAEEVARTNDSGAKYCSRGFV
jgi:hypothetical protein